MGVYMNVYMCGWWELKFIIEEIIIYKGGVYIVMVLFYWR